MTQIEVGAQYARTFSWNYSNGGHLIKVGNKKINL